MAKAATKKALDPVEDFENPVRRDASLEAMNDVPARAHVAGKKALMHFVRVRPVKLKDGTRQLKLELSFPLSEPHLKLFGSVIGRAFQALQPANDDEFKSVEIGRLGPHILRLYEVSDQGAPSVEESSVRPESIVLRTVEETGTGAEQDVTRLSVVVPITQTRDGGDWCLRMHGELVWVELVPMQGTLS